MGGTQAVLVEGHLLVVLPLTFGGLLGVNIVIMFYIKPLGSVIRHFHSVLMTFKRTFLIPHQWGVPLSEWRSWLSWMVVNKVKLNGDKIF